LHNEYFLIKEYLIRYRTWISIAIFVFLFFFLSHFIYVTYPVLEHWKMIFRPAALELINFRNPYLVPKFFNPPWVLIPIIPFALLPEKLGNAFWAALSILGLGFTFRKMGANWYLTICFLLNPFTLYNMVQVNIDWIVAIGFILPPQWGLLLVMIKPQIGGFLALYWAIISWKNGGAREIWRVFGPVFILFLLSFIIFGNYFAKAEFMITYFGDKQTLWPFSIPIGLALFVVAIRDKKFKLSIATAPMLSTYIQPYSFPLALYGLLPDSWITGAGLLGLWLMIYDPRFDYIINRILFP